MAASLGSCTTRQLDGKRPTLLVPLGSTEQHGPHLPLDTDTRIAEAVCALIVVPDGLVAPPIQYGSSGEHQGFPGTVSIGTPALALLLTEYGRSASHWAARLLFVNGHGGNLDALRAGVGMLRREGRDAAWLSCAAVDSDPHAGHTETSVLLHLSPELVDVAAARPGNTEPLAAVLPRLRAAGVAAVSPSGVLGDPSNASAADGVAILAGMVADCAARVRRWMPGDDGMLM